MPFIETLTSVAIPAEKEKILKEKFGKAIEALPGKSERWLMLHFEDKARMAFAGDGNTPAAMLKVDVYGEGDYASFDKLTGLLTDIVSEELGIPKNRVYVRFSETPYWGYNGGLF